MIHGDIRPLGEATCIYITGPDVNRDVCGRPATFHQEWPDGEWSALSCDEHAAVARVFGINDEHPFGGVCNMPGSGWVHSTEDGPGRCVWQVDDEQLVAAANRDDASEHDTPAEILDVKSLDCHPVTQKG